MIKSDPFRYFKTSCEIIHLGGDVVCAFDQNTLRALGDYKRTGRLEAIPLGTKNDGNGSIMRLAAVLIHAKSYSLGQTR
ncbi:hypothetical protein C1J03_13475 [Sulfitobacter sp. SK012]|nr:hypothetical protein C1J03_13475 [Sulfitobacter sp. SK012]